MEIGVLCSESVLVLGKDAHDEFFTLHADLSFVHGRIEAEGFANAAGSVHDRAVDSYLAYEYATAGLAPVKAGDQQQEAATELRAEELPGLHCENGVVRVPFVLAAVETLRGEHFGGSTVVNQCDALQGASELLV